MTEINEQQFSFLKEMCDNEAYIMVIPELNVNDTHFKELQGLIDGGCLEDITPAFADAQHAGRPFAAFSLTRQAVQMFTSRAASFLN